MASKTNFNGLESPLKRGRRDNRPPIVNIHHGDSRQHWLASFATRGMLEVCDSLRLKKLPDVAADQLIHVYAHLYVQKDELPFTILPTQRQTGLNCGLHAIACVTQICCGEDPTDHFDHDKLRNHLIACLEDGKMTPLAKIQRRGRRAKSVRRSISTST